MESDDKKPGGIEASELLKYLIGATAVTVGVMFFWDFLAVRWFGYDYGKRANFGDEFGPVGIFLSGITFFLLILSTIFQRSDLKAQTEALRLQQTALEQQIKEFSEQKEELARSAAAQERANQIAELRFKTDLISQRMAFDLAHVQRGDTHSYISDSIRKHIRSLEELLAHNGITTEAKGDH